MTTALPPDEPPKSSSAKLTPEERRRRKQRRAWIPTIVIVGVIAVAIAAAAFFQASGIGKPVHETSNDSKFNLSGIRAINGAADAQVDVRKPPSAASVGLPANSSTTIGPFTGITLEVDFVGDHGTETIFVDSMRIATSHGSVTSISTTIHDFGYTFIHDQLIDYSVLGISPQQLAAFEDAMPNDAGGPRSHFTLAVGDGDALGVPTHVIVSCDGAKGCTVGTNTVLPTS